MFVEELDIQKGEKIFVTFIMNGQFGILSKRSAIKDNMFNADFFLEEREKFKRLTKEKRELESLFLRKTPFGGWYI